MWQWITTKITTKISVIVMRIHQKFTVKFTSNSLESEKLNSVWCGFSNRKSTSIHIISTSIFNILMNDEMSKKLLNELIKWINENDEFVDIDDVHDQTDVDSTSNDANAFFQLIANTNFSTSFDFDFSKISSFAFDSADSSLSTYFESHRETFSQIRREEERKKASTQYEKKNSFKRRKWWKMNIDNDLFWTIIYINYIFHVSILIKCIYINYIYLFIWQDVVSNLSSKQIKISYL